MARQVLEDGRGKNSSSSSSERMASGEERFNVRLLTPAQRRRLNEIFARHLIQWLQDPKAEGIRGWGLLEKVGQEFYPLISRKPDKIDVRQFAVLLKCLFQDGYLQLRPPLIADRVNALEERFDPLRAVVVAGVSADDFGKAAAAKFVSEMARIGKRKKELGQDLYLGVVSGSTCAEAVRAATDPNADWAADYDVDCRDLPKINLLALNVCLTEPQFLFGNATILVHQLAEKINQQSRKPIARAYGLSAPLVVRRSELPRIDQLPQTFEVVRFAEPKRVEEKLRQEGQRSGQAAFPELKEDATSLDIVLTGVGERPPQAASEEESIFLKLAKGFAALYDLDIDDLFKEERIVGDIGFYPIRGNGDRVALKARRRGDTNDHADAASSGEGEEILFYSAFSLPILEAMARQPDKAVILVARHTTGKDKIPAIYAAVSGKNHRYASMLIVDELTAKALEHY